MANHRLGETNMSESGPSNYAVLHGLSPSPNPFINQGGSAFDFGELQEAIVLHGVRIGNHDDSKPSPLYAAAAVRPAATLDMFPSWPMRFHQTNTGNSRSGEDESNEDSGSALNTISSRGEGHLLEPESPISTTAPSTTDRSPQHLSHDQMMQQQQHQQQMPSDGSGEAGPTQIAKLPQEKRHGARSDKVLDAKMLRRLAQNREAARKSRLRKKAYVQQLESSRIRLAQLEQDLQRARAQGLFLVGAGGVPANISSGAAMFDMEYARWLEDDLRHMTELRAGLHSQLSDGDLRVVVDAYINHYDDIFRLKGEAAKSDIFHLYNGMWTTPAERCFLWLGGFKPSELIKILIPQLDPLTEQQLMGICSLQHSSQQAEEALSQGLDQLQQSLVDTVAGTSIPDGMHQMAVALGKLANLEGFVRQADNLRQQTLHQLRRILTIRQAAKCFLVIGEYYARLRALSSLWASRPRESLMNEGNMNQCQAGPELQIVQQPMTSQFPPFFGQDPNH